MRARTLAVNGTVTSGGMRMPSAACSVAINSGSAS
jgi:hypothetical protein